jgi:hypothetical protein
VDTATMRSFASITEDEALAAFQSLLDGPPVAFLGLNVVFGGLERDALVGEDPLYTDLAYSMAGPHRPALLAEASRRRDALEDPATRQEVLASRRSARIEAGRVLMWLHAEHGEIEDPPDL